MVFTMIHNRRRRLKLVRSTTEFFFITFYRGAALKYINTTHADGDTPWIMRARSFMNPDAPGFKGAIKEYMLSLALLRLRSLYLCMVPRIILAN